MFSWTEGVVLNELKKVIILMVRKLYCTFKRIGVGDTSGGGVVTQVGPN
jgi:hypothetical protein